MDNLAQELMNLTEWDKFNGLWLPIGFKVVMAIICGGIIGLERELKHKPAGLRTNMLICLGAVLYTIVGDFIHRGVAPGSPADPGRVVAQIVSGIGFLGGGMIIQSGGAVSGLTSAATIWVVAAIGISIGVGYPLTSFVFTVTVFFALYFLSKVDHKVFGKMHGYECHIHLKKSDAKARAQIMDTFQFGDLELNRLLVSEHEGHHKIVAKYYCGEARHLRVQAALWSVSSVESIDVKMS